MGILGPVNRLLNLIKISVRRLRVSGFQLAIILALAFGAMLSSFPFLWMILSAFKTPGEMDLMARIAGLRLVERFANWQQSPFDIHSNAHISIYGLDKRCAANTPRA